MQVGAVPSTGSMEGWSGLSERRARRPRAGPGQPGVVETLEDPEVISALANYGIEAQPRTAADMVSVFRGC